MTLANDEYGRRTLEFVANVAQAKTGQDICDLVVTEMAWYGLTFVTSWSMPDVEGDVTETIELNTRPPSYTEHYRDAGYIYKDPIVSAMRRSMVAQSWSDVRESMDMNKSERFIIEEARDFGATDGLTIPVVSASGCVGVFSPCGRDPNLSPRARAALDIVGVYAHQALRRFNIRQIRQVKPHQPLTPREREVMRWVAIGKTNDEIGSILNIERATVKTLLSRAQEKLNASRRSYAVVQALRLGELDLNF